MYGTLFVALFSIQLKTTKVPFVSTEKKCPSGGDPHLVPRLAAESFDREREVVTFQGEVAGLTARPLKRVDEAKADLQRALELEPTMWPARLELSRPENVK